MKRASIALAALVACGGQKTNSTAPTASATVAVSPPSASAPAEPTGRVDPEVVRKVIRDAREHFLICYAAGLKKKRDLAGRVETKFVIDETGHVSSAEDVTHSNVLPDDATRDCIVSKFRKLEFPPPQPSGTVTITYPLLLDPTMVATAEADAGAPPAGTDDYHHDRPPFDRDAAAKALGKVDVRPCHAPAGSWHVRVTLDPSGVPTNAVLDSPTGPAAHTAAAACILQAVRAIRITPFAGSAVTVGKAYRVP